MAVNRGVTNTSSSKLMRRCGGKIGPKNPVFRWLKSPEKDNGQRTAALGLQRGFSLGSRLDHVESWRS